MRITRRQANPTGRGSGRQLRGETRMLLDTFVNTAFVNTVFIAFLLVFFANFF